MPWPCYKVAFVILQSRFAHAQPCWLCACAGLARCLWLCLSSSFLAWPRAHWHIGLASGPLAHWPGLRPTGTLAWPRAHWHICLASGPLAHWPGLRPTGTLAWPQAHWHIGLASGPEPETLYTGWASTLILSR